MKIGHTGITWGIPGDVEQAYRETAELGYLGFETFSRTVLQWRGDVRGYQALVDRYGIPTSAVYCHKNWTNSDAARQELESAKREADAARAVGVETVVLQAGPRPTSRCSGDHFGHLADALNDLGAYCRRIGLSTGLHPHTGTAIETREDIDDIMERLDPDLVGFVPDTGQIAKGGTDILEVIRTYRDRIVHVHLKDWSGVFDHDAEGQEIDTTGYANYQPIGYGILPIAAVLKLLREIRFDHWINVELDGGSRSPRPPRDAAAMSRRYLAELLGDQVVWGN